jgi:hypothetical protein
VRSALTAHFLISRPESRTCENINGRPFFIARLIRPPNLPTNGRDTMRLESCLRTQCYCWGSTVEYTHSAVNSHNVRPHGDLMHRGIRRATQGIIRVRFLQRQINTFQNVHRFCMYEKREGPICVRAYVLCWLIKLNTHCVLRAVVLCIVPSNWLFARASIAAFFMERPVDMQILMSVHPF